MIFLIISLILIIVTVSLMSHNKDKMVLFIGLILTAIIVIFWFFYILEKGYMIFLLMSLISIIVMVLLKKYKKKKVVLLFIGSILIAITVTLWSCYSKITKNGLDNYENERSAYKSSSYALPELDTLPEYTNIRYQYRHLRLFSSVSQLLVVTYDEKTYINEKKKLKQYDFLDHVVRYDEQYEIPEYEFSINSFNFKVLDEMDDRFHYPKYFGMIAVSDEKNSIAYMYFYNMSLDFISENTGEGTMKEFVEKYYKYDW